MKKVIVRMACGLLLEDEKGQVLHEPGLDVARIVKITVVIPWPPRWQIRGSGRHSSRYMTSYVQSYPGRH